MDKILIDGITSVFFPLDYLLSNEGVLTVSGGLTTVRTYTVTSCLSSHPSIVFSLPIIETSSYCLPFTSTILINSSITGGFYEVNVRPLFGRTCISDISRRPMSNDTWPEFGTVGSPF